MTTESTCLAVVCLLAGAVISTIAEAAPISEQTCGKFVANSAGSGLTQADCLCMYRVADAVLDDDIKALLFDSWLNGTDNTSALENLPGRGRVKRQLLGMKRTTDANCFGPP